MRLVQIAALVPFAAIAILATADDVTIRNVTRVPHDVRKLAVTFDQPPPQRDAALSTSRWSGQCFHDESTPPSDLKVVTAEHVQTKNATTFESTPTIRLTFATNVTNDCQMVVITFLAPKFPSGRWAKKAKSAAGEAAEQSPSAKIFAPVGTQDSPDYSISGTVVPAVGSGPVYSMDVSISPKLLRGVPNSLGFTATAKTDSSKTADPDSFSWSIDFMRVPTSSLAEKVSFAGMEFDKANSVRNFVSSGALRWTKFRPKINTQGRTVYSASLDLRGGIEIGSNLENSYTSTSVPVRSSSGFLLRGVPQAKFFFVVPTTNPKHAIRFTSRYEVRLPAKDEIFLETRHVKDPVPKIGTNPRHYVENTLTFKANDYFGFTLQHSYGSLPPAFKFVDHRGSVGIVFQAKQP